MARTAIGAITFQAVADADLTSAAINIDSSGDNSVIAAASASIIRVYRMFLIPASAVAVTFKDGTGGGATALTGAMSLAANQFVDFNFQGEPWFVCSNDSPFNINLGSAVQVSGRVYYTQG